LKEVNCAKGVVVYNKFKKIIENNYGIRRLSSILCIVITGQEAIIKKNTRRSLSNDLAYIMYDPISFTDVEQSFSHFKNIFSENQHVFSFENLFKSLLVKSNSSGNL